MTLRPLFVQALLARVRSPRRSRARAVVLPCVLSLALPLGLSGCELLDLLFACDYETDPSCEDPERGHILGTVSVPTAGPLGGASAPVRHASDERLEQARATFRAALAASGRATLDEGQKDAPRHRTPEKRYRKPLASTANEPPKGSMTEPRWRPGEVIVRAHDGVPARSDKAGLAETIERFLDDGTRVEIRLCNTDTMCLAELRNERGDRLGEIETVQVAERLRRLNDVLRYAEPNRVLQMTRTPNDQLYPIQWHYGAMRLPAAWDITTGHPDVVAAVIDTGILLDHPELKDRVIGGADLIDDPDVARDGDGRDNDGHDVGDNACGPGCHSHHGSHVAGTMAAATNNGSMVAGVAWQGSLLSVRVLGQGGGALFDIAGGIYWSVGSSVDGVRTNPTPADVLNLSLGGPGESDALNEAVADAVSTGAIVVVAAGNNNIDASGFTPANAPAALTVAALGNVGGDRTTPRKASYSNYGTTVDIAAPGGEQAEDVDRDGNPDGVLSTAGDSVVFYQGTSMAAPHIAGLAMLMKSLDPNITQDEAKAILRQTADTSVSCNQGCGAGMANAVRALRAMQGEDGTPLVVPTPAVTRIGRADKDARVVFENVGGSAAQLTLSVGGPDRERVKLSTSGGRLGPDEKLVVDIDIERTGTDHGEATLTASYDDGKAAEAQLIWTDEAINAATTVAVGALRIEGERFTVEREVFASRADGYRYKLFNLRPGDYLVIGLSDDDNDGEFEEHEGVGVFPSLQESRILTVRAGERIQGTDFLVAPAFLYEDDAGAGDGPVGAACEDSLDCEGGLYCEPAFDGGYCTRDCSGGPELCPSGSACFCLGDDGAGGCQYSICLKGCSRDNECRTSEGYVCDVDNTCYPG